MTAISALDEPALRAAYAADGVAHVRAALNEAWVERMRGAVDRAMAVPSNDAMEFVPPGEDGRFFGDMFMHRRDADFRALFFKTPCAEIAGRAMGAAEVRLFYDQIFAKAPNTPRETPWHQDGPYWPISGEMACTVYLALDAIDDGNGAVRYARGSHLPGRDFRPAPFRSGADNALRYAGSALPAVEAPDEATLVSFKLEPGDAVVFHGRMVHGAPGNPSADRPRRTIALRFTGEDIRWQHGISTFGRLRKADLPNGAPLSARDALFPVLWKRR